MTPPSDTEFLRKERATKSAKKIHHCSGQVAGERQWAKAVGGLLQEDQHGESWKVLLGIGGGGELGEGKDARASYQLAPKAKC